MDSSTNVVSSQVVEGGEALVDNQEASRSGVPAPAAKRLNWTEVFLARPDLSPPGYEQAMLAANEKTRIKKERLLEAAAEKAKSQGRRGKK